MILKRVFFIFYFFVGIMVFSQNFSDYYNNGVKFEKENKINLAIENYKLAIEKTTFSKIKERLELKIARIEQNPEKKIQAYLNFISKYPNSRLIYIATYELATVYYLLGNTNKSIEYFTKLYSISYGTPYYGKVCLFLANIYIENNKFDNALFYLYKLFEVAEDYFELSECYYFTGKVFYKKGKINDAKDYYYVALNNYKNSWVINNILKDLIEIAILENDYDKMAFFYSYMKNSYGDDKNVRERLLKIISQNELDKKYDYNKMIKESILDKESKNIVLETLQKELSESMEFSFEDDKKSVLKTGIYVQVGFLRSEKSANAEKERIERIMKNSVIIYRGYNNDGEFFRLYIGPFQNRKEAGDYVLKLKDSKLDGFVTEINLKYE